MAIRPRDGGEDSSRPGRECCLWRYRIAGQFAVQLLLGRIGADLPRLLKVAASGSKEFALAIYGQAVIPDAAPFVQTVGIARAFWRFVTLLLHRSRPPFLVSTLLFRYGTESCTQQFRG